jgi:putative hemolysin
VVEIVVILLLILLNGLFSMSELAVISARKVRLLHRAEDGDQGARQALELAEKPTRFLSTVQIGITLIGTLAGAFGGAALAGDLANLLARIPLPIFQDRENAETVALALIVLLITYLSLVLGELVPKRLALADPEGIAAWAAGPMAALSRITGPVVGLLALSTEAMMRLLGVKKSPEPPVTPKEITVMMEQGEQLGVFEQTETDIVEAVFRLGDLRAGALMTPRPEIEWIDANDPITEILRQVLDSTHTTFPIAEGNLDNVHGILRAKDLVARAAGGAEPNLTDLIQPVQFVPESMMAFQVLELLRTASGNLVLVIDEYGGPVGIVTLFDVMAAMVGSISVRGEPVEPEAIQREDGSWLVEGMMRIDDFKRLFDMDDLPDEDRAGYQTVGGFVMAQAGAVPRSGESFTCNDWKFEVLDMDGLRVDKILVSKPSA